MKGIFWVGKTRHAICITALHRKSRLSRYDLYVTWRYTMDNSKIYWPMRSFNNNVNMQWQNVASVCSLPLTISQPIVDFGHWSAPTGVTGYSNGKVQRRQIYCRQLAVLCENHVGLQHSICHHHSIPIGPDRQRSNSFRVPMRYQAQICI